MRKYKLNEDYFEIIDNENKAYWLGFVSADGGINNQNTKKYRTPEYSLRINLQGSDFEHLEKFSTEIQSNYPIRITERKSKDTGKILYTANLSIYSKKLINDLFKLGVTERKSFTLEPCCQISNDLLKHYWRGYFDGNGTIRYEKSNKSWHLSLVGSEKIAIGFHNFISMFVANKAQVRKSRNIYSIGYGGNHEVKDIWDILYNNSEIYLERKKILFDEMLKLDIKEHHMQGLKTRKNATSKYVGVRYCKKAIKKWNAIITTTTNGITKEYNLGYYATEEEAAITYNKKALELYGENARLNIIIEDYKKDNEK
jgi:DNA-binding transcriptional regulator WhiA